MIFIWGHKWVVVKDDNLKTDILCTKCKKTFVNVVLMAKRKHLYFVPLDKDDEGGYHCNGCNSFFKIDPALRVLIECYYDKTVSLKEFKKYWVQFMKEGPESLPVVMRFRCNKCKLFIEEDQSRCPHCKSNLLGDDSVDVLYPDPKFRKKLGIFYE